MLEKNLDITRKKKIGLFLMTRKLVSIKERLKGPGPKCKRIWITKKEAFVPVMEDYHISALSRSLPRTSTHHDATSSLAEIPRGSTWFLVMELFMEKGSVINSRLQSFTKSLANSIGSQLVILYQQFHIICDSCGTDRSES